MAIQAQLYSDNIGFPLCGSHDWIDNGCVGNGEFNQFCFGFQRKPQLQQLQEQQHLQQQVQNHQPWNQSLGFDNSNYRESMTYCQTMVSQIEKQRHDIDQFIRSQNERLRLLLQEQRKQQFAVLGKKIESKASVLLRQKDEEIAKATNKIMQLQNLLKKLEMENQAWQRVAQENEAMVVSLNNTLEQLREQQACRCLNNGVDDAESCCDEVNREGTETGENRGFAGLVAAADDGQQQEERSRKTTTTMVCKCCNSRSSCILFLPCRHLCSCKDCAAFLDSCPVCRTEKKAIIEALIS